MKQSYKRFIVGALKAVFLSGLLFSFTPEAKACHGLPILNLTQTVNPTNVTITGDSDPATCGCGPYYMQVELACNTSSFTNAPPVYTSPSWGTYPWFQSILNAPLADACALEPYTPLVIPFSQLCPGTTYYYRVREFVATGTTAAWSTTVYSFTTPGQSPQLTAQVANSSQYTVCVGAQVQLNAAVTGGCSGGYLYTWTPASGLNNPNIANPVATISGPITYTCTMTDVCVGSPVTDTVAIQIGAPPVAGTASTVPSAICAGGSAMVILTGQQGNLQWQQSPDGINWFNIVGGTNDTLNVGPLNSSLYYQAIVTGTGCGSSVSNVTVVTVAPSPTVNAGPNLTICAGQQDTIITSNSGGVTYNWSPSNTLNSQFAQSPLAAPTVTTTYTVTVTDGNGCVGTDQVTVTVSNITTNAGQDITLCSGNQATILANANGAISYSWSPPTGLSSTTVPNPVAGPASTTTYVVTATNQYGCADNDTIVVNITPAPPISVSNDTAMCAGGIAQLVASGAQSYTWSPATGLSSTTIANPTASPLATTTYIVVGNNGGCLDYDTVTVNITPPPAAFAGPDFSICTGAQGTLNATGGVQYTWSPTSTIIGSPNQASVTVAPTTTTTYSVVVVNQGGCISTDQITVTVNPLPTVTANSNDYTICAGSSANLSASGAAGYVWSPSTGLSSTISAVPSATPGNTTIYTVTGTDANGCTDTDTVRINVVPLPYADLLYGNPTLCGDTTGTISIGQIIGGPGPYTYTVNGVPSTPVNNTFGVYGAGTYTVVITDAAGCQGSGTALIWVDASQLGINASATPTIGVAPQFVNFYSSVSGGINNYTWDFGDGGPNGTGQNPTYTYTQPGTYTVTVIGYNDNPVCSSTDTIVIDIFPDIIVVTPNVFTPNNDGVNDFFLSELQGVKDIKYTIYNRWGNLIREVVGVTSSWDGKNKNGNDVDDGTYYYVITATGYDDTTKEIAGFVQLIRGPK
jgi:gliding motility-associated-like protein